MKQINNTCMEVLPGLLDKSKTQTIRKAWKVITKNFNRPGPLFEDKPADYKIGDKARMVWNKDSPHDFFCSGCGGQCDSIKFNKNLGTVEITEVFQIVINKHKDNEFFIDALHCPMPMIHGRTKYDLAKEEGFKSAEDMFAYFDKNYNLSIPRKFWVYHWRWI